MTTDREKWNKRHGERLGLEIEDISAWLSRHQSRIQAPGLALDVACGRGRHAIYLAELGWTVHAFDISDTAIDELHRRAERDRLPIQAQVVDLEGWSAEPDVYDLILVFRYLDRELFPALESALKPGGLLFYETFVADPQGRSSMNPAFLLQPGELPSLVPNLEVVSYEETFRQGRKHGTVGRLIARKPSGRKPR